jgi:hypothetical protein
MGVGANCTVACLIRRAEALGSINEARLRGLIQATKVAFVT